MTLSWIRSILMKIARPVSTSDRRRQPKPSGYVPAVEFLGDRILPAVTAVFVPSTGVLTVLGDAANNAIDISRNAAGAILVNGGAIQVVGGAPTVGNTTTITVFGQSGDDTISLDEANGVLPKALLFGGAGNDLLTGGAGADQLFGQAGNDTLLGKGGDDLLFGGAGNDVLTGGVGTDQAYGQAGNDRMIWNPGDGNDLNEGGTGSDTVEVNGGNVAETFTVTPNGKRVRFDRTDPGPFSIDIGTSENLVLNAAGGDDTITASNGLATLISLTVDGGAGNDRITGGDGNDRLTGGDGNDVVNGGRGNDTVFLGAGDDTFVWNAGDGSDLVEGQDGIDTLQFNGADVNERITASANGSRLRVTRDVGTVVMDVNGTERVDLNARGGVDTITVGNLTSTGVTDVNVGLANTNGAGDTATDTVIVNGTAGNDALTVAGNANGIDVLGLAAKVHITGSEPADRLNLNMGAGDDAVEATGLAAGAIRLTVDGSDGDDVLTGSAGIDTLLGGAGDDVLVGGDGQDILDGGPGANLVIQ